MEDNSADCTARPLPVTIEAIDCAWLTRALRVRAPGVTVRGFEPGGAPGFYDVVPRRAAPMSEVRFHITLALDVADRRRWEGALVRHYLDELVRDGVADAPGIDMPEGPITAYAARFSAAILDHDTAGLLSRVSPHSAQ